MRVHRLMIQQQVCTLHYSVGFVCQPGIDSNFADNSFPRVLLELHVRILQGVHSHLNPALFAYRLSMLQADARSAAVQAILTRRQAGLLPALKGGEQGGTLHARRLTTALQACPASKLTALLALGPCSAACWAATLCRCFAFERSAATLVMHNTSRAGPHIMLGGTPTNTASDTSSSAVPVSNENRSDIQQLHNHDEEDRQLPHPTGVPQHHVNNACQSTGDRSAETVGSEQQQADQRPKATALLNAAHQDSVVLPRMALGLTYVTSQATYAAVAGVARTLGHAAAAADYDGTDSTGTACLNNS